MSIWPKLQTNTNYFCQALITPKGTPEKPTIFITPNTVLAKQLAKHITPKISMVKLSLKHQIPLYQQNCGGQKLQCHRNSTIKEPITIHPSSSSVILSYEWNNNTAMSNKGHIKNECAKRVQITQTMICQLTTSF